MSTFRTRLLPRASHDAGQPYGSCRSSDGIIASGMRVLAPMAWARATACLPTTRSVRLILIRPTRVLLSTVFALAVAAVGVHAATAVAADASKTLRVVFSIAE